MGQALQASQFGFENFFCHSPQDAVCPVGYVYEGSNHFPPSRNGRSLVERYACADFAIYLGLRKWPLPETIEPCTDQYAVLLHWPWPPTGHLADLSVSPQLCEVELERLKHRARDMDKAVLVGIREFLEMPERTPFALPCSTIFLGERLFRSDQRDGLRVDALEELADPVPLKPIHIYEDGKLIFRLRIGNDKLVNSVVQGRTQVVNDLTDLNSPHRVGSSFEFGNDGKFAGVSVEIDRCTIGASIASIEKGVDLAIEQLDLIACPLTLKANPV